MFVNITNSSKIFMVKHLGYCVCMHSRIMLYLQKIILVILYVTVFMQFLKTLLIVDHKDIVDLNYMIRPSGTLKKITRALKKFKENETTMTFDFRQQIRFATDLIFILRWTEAMSHFTTPSYEDGQKSFIDHKCTLYNCYFTKDKSLLLDLRNFDAIVFDVENTWDLHPVLRAPHQKYIFSASESAAIYPICHPVFDSYYNLTWTYRLDSDVRWTFISIFDKSGTLVGPRVNMSWINPMQPTPETIIKKLSSKNTAAAWFVSNCNPKNSRKLVAGKLRRALQRYGHHIDIYGWCGNLTCPRDSMNICLNKLEKKYYFYLSFENSDSEDYVTEKLLYPLQHYTVPVVYGGADYLRFLPPGSFINAKELDADSVAFRINEAIRNGTVYQNYFRWHNHYEYKSKSTEPDICSLCRKLQVTGVESVTSNFRKTWNPDYETQCQESENRFIEI